MIIDERTYTLHSGKAPEYLKIVETQLLPLQRVMLGGFMGYFHTEVGTLNQVVHLWAYDDMADRERRRARLASHPDWSSQTALVRPLIVTQRNRILVAAAFSPMVRMYKEQRQPLPDLPS
ncbi:NIPSNAP family protein [Variovorax paradoxus]|uniref:NIPSNAP family protein n=1 Tax=Variovorax paradoxus TaxID=34073 RepID=UPI001934041B|nr:NIPSNAP family protein [Variovorax paradoxus]